MIDAKARERIGLARLERSPSIAARLRVAGEIILGLVLVLAAYGWHQERDQADRERAKAETGQRIAEQALVNCLNGGASMIVEGEMQAVWCDKATVERL